MNRRHNQHYQNTHRRLIQTMLDIIDASENARAQVTVRQVCERTGINRSTFYAHFTDIPDMFEQTEAILSAQLRECYPEELAVFSFVPFLSHIRTHRKFYRASVEHRIFLQPKEDMNMIAERFLLPAYERQNGSIPQEDRPFCRSSICFSVYGIVRLWIEDDCRRPVEEIEQIIQKCLPIDFPTDKPIPEK